MAARLRPLTALTVFRDREQRRSTITKASHVSPAALSAAPQALAGRLTDARVPLDGSEDLRGRPSRASSRTLSFEQVIGARLGEDALAV
jgi:hypothetical protein